MVGRGRRCAENLRILDGRVGALLDEELDHCPMTVERRVVQPSARVIKASRNRVHFGTPF
jgi:hypothetical protein